MFFGFVPVGMALISLIASFGRRAGLARGLWAVTTFLVVIWTLYHGAHHLPVLSTYSAW
jgi:hypothetical protein